MKNSIKMLVCALALSTTGLSTTSAFAETTDKDTTAVQVTASVEEKTTKAKALQNLPASIPVTEIEAPCKERIVQTKKHTPEQKAAITGIQFSSQSR